MTLVLTLFILAILAALGWLIRTRFEFWRGLAEHFPADGQRVGDDFEAVSRIRLTIRRFFVFRWVHAMVFERGMLIHTAFMLRPTGITMFIPWDAAERIDERTMLGEPIGVDIHLAPGAPEERLRISSRAFAAAVEKFAPEATRSPS